MKGFNELNFNIKTKSKIIEQKNDLRCPHCGNLYDYVKFDNGQEEKIGCDCKIKQMAKEQTIRYKNKIKRLEIEKIFKNSIIPEDLLSASFENYEPRNESQEKLLEHAKRYADNFSLDNKQSLLLQGTYGLGKSHIAISVVKEVKDKGFTALFMDVPQLITAYRDTFNKDSNLNERQLDQIIKNVDLLALDDYGTTVSQFGNQKLFDVMNMRQGKHNILTTNNSAEELSRNKDFGKNFSRALKNTTIIKVYGDDYRMKGVKTL
ncbi:putative DNA replication protein [uncultured Caudovirales phage]|uniref:Putative DNA replication protein n=1 Tax=uncultured Caudovirales phage TaxID=2100421 RepID=A0A2H4JCH7_9CAUD|nr:putative DNA replication protein [uncultured Caudovirales phage]